MSKGLGRIERACLRSLGRRPRGATTYTLVADVYRIKPDQDGNRMCSDAQHTSVKRALRGLQRKGLIASYRAIDTVRLNPDRTFMDVSGHAERCTVWSLPGVMPTVGRRSARAVADAAHVSLSTARRVLRQHLLEIAAE